MADAAARTPAAAASDEGPRSASQSASPPPPPPPDWRQRLLLAAATLLVLAALVSAIWPPPPPSPPRQYTGRTRGRAAAAGGSHGWRPRAARPAGRQVLDLTRRRRRAGGDSRAAATRTAAIGAARRARWRSPLSSGGVTGSAFRSSKRCRPRTAASAGSRCRRPRAASAGRPTRAADASSSGTSSSSSPTTPRAGWICHTPSTLRRVPADACACTSCRRRTSARCGSGSTPISKDHWRGRSLANCWRHCVRTGSTPARASSPTCRCASTAPGSPAIGRSPKRARAARRWSPS